MPDADEPLEDEQDHGEAPDAKPQDPAEIEPRDAPEEEPRSCCALRRKVLVGILRVLPEAACGVADSELADVMRFDLETPSGKPVLAFKFCPWCGEPRAPGDAMRITDVELGGPGGGGSLGS